MLRGIAAAEDWLVNTKRVAKGNFLANERPGLKEPSRAGRGGQAVLERPGVLRAGAAVPTQQESEEKQHLTPRVLLIGYK